MTAEVTVVVPTRDRPAALGRCLAALSRQDTSAAVDTVVVDDGSHDAGAVAATVARFDGVRLLVAGGEGPAAARNIGARSADSPIVAFTDDDCAPVPGWLSSLLGRFATGASVVAGPTTNGRPDDAFAQASQVVTNHLVRSGLVDGSVRFAPTSNLAVTADVHARLPFDEAFPLAAGEDRDYCDRLVAEGLSIAYEPCAEVLHFQELGARGFWRQQRRYGEGGVHWRQRSPERGRQRAGFYTSLLRAGFDSGARVGALVVTSQVAVAVGMLRARR